MKRTLFGLNKNIFFLGLTSLFNDFSSEMVFAVFPAFFTSVLGAGAASLGLVDGIAESVSNFFKIYSGNLSDRIRKRKLPVVLGYACSVFTRPLYGSVSGVAGALGLRVADRMGKGLRDAPRDALISLSAPPRALGRSFGYHRAMDTAGAILGPFAAYLLLRFFPLRFDLVFFAAFGIGLAAIAALFFVSEIKNPIAGKNRTVFSAFKKLPRQFKLFLLSFFVLSLGSMPIAVLLLKTKTIGLAIASIPLFYMLYNLSYAGFSIVAGAISDKTGPRAVLPIGYLALIASYALLGSARSVPALAAGFLALGFFPAFTDGVQRALAAEMTAEDARGSAFGFLNAANGFGVLGAGIGGGYVWQTYGPAAAFAAASAVIAFGLLLFAAASGKFRA